MAGPSFLSVVRVDPVPCPSGMAFGSDRSSLVRALAALKTCAPELLNTAVRLAVP